MLCILVHAFVRCKGCKEPAWHLPASKPFMQVDRELCISSLHYKCIYQHWHDSGT
jgi:hypothetical protein